MFYIRNIDLSDAQAVRNIAEPEHSPRYAV